MEQCLKKITNMKIGFYFLFIFFGITNVVNGQSNAEIFPIFPKCESETSNNLENCFYASIEDYFFENFKTAETFDAVSNQKIIAVFEVDTLGVFKVLYVDAPSNELKLETERVFQLIPKVKPAQFLGKPIYSKYTIKFNLPLDKNNTLLQKDIPNKTNVVLIDNSKELTEFEDVAKSYTSFDNATYKSNIIIPFSHANYSVFEALLNQVGSNNHTATKPYSYADVAQYYDFETVTLAIKKNKSSWGGRKLWNENLVEIRGENYWFTLNPILDLQIGKDTESKLSKTFVNTRGIQFQGELGNSISFSTSIYETQAQFADYYNQYARSLKPSGGNPAIVPGIGIAKQFKKESFDIPMAEGYLKYKASNFINLQLGYGRNFIGDGYRSLLQSDATSPYPYLKMNTKFWKIKYTNTYMWLKDVRPEETVDGTYATKYMASHYLSYNVSKKLNIGLFENVVWANTNNRGFDVNFVNPIIFYRAVEFSSSSKSGNAVLGASAKYKWNNQVNLYGQFILDEFAIGDVKEANKSWRNKYGYQIGAKYYDAFKIKNLQLQVEYNRIRPYVYSHSNPLTNYAHNNQSMGHAWGANFSELLLIARYNKERYFGEVVFTLGKRGFDFNTPTNSFNYGGAIYESYNDNRPFDKNVIVGQGNTTDVLIANAKVGYLVNPASNLKVFGTVLYRNFDPMSESATTFKSNTTWFSVGIRSDLFNWYLDY